MTTTLTARRKEIIKTQGLLLLRDNETVHDLSSFISMTVGSDPAVELFPLRYKYPQIIHNKALTQNHGNYDSYVILDSHALDLIHWWINNVDAQMKSLRSCLHQLEMYVDACLTGWGATLGNAKTGGHWAYKELLHINCLELKAIL